MSARAGVGLPGISGAVVAIISTQYWCYYRCRADVVPLVLVPQYRRVDI